MSAMQDIMISAEDLADAAVEVYNTFANEDTRQGVVTLLGMLLMPDVLDSERRDALASLIIIGAGGGR